MNQAATPEVEFFAKDPKEAEVIDFTEAQQRLETALIDFSPTDKVANTKDMRENMMQHLGLILDVPIKLWGEEDGRKIASRLKMIRIEYVKGNKKMPEEGGENKIYLVDVDKKHWKAIEDRVYRQKQRQLVDVVSTAQFSKGWLTVVVALASITKVLDMLHMERRISIQNIESEVTRFLMVVLDMTSNNNFIKEMKTIIKEHSLQYQIEAKRISEDPNHWIKIKRRLDMAAGLNPPKSLVELRSRDDLYYIMFTHKNIYNSEIPSEEDIKEEIQIRERHIKRRQTLDFEHPQPCSYQNVYKWADVLLPDLLLEDSLQYFALDHPQIGRLLAYKASAISEDTKSKLELLTTSVDERLVEADYYVNLAVERFFGKGHEKVIVAYLPTIQEVEKSLYMPQAVEGEFFDENTEKNPDPNNRSNALDNSKAKNGDAENWCLPRLECLRNAIIRTGQTVKFARDKCKKKTDVRMKQSFTEAARGEFIICTFVDIPLQIIISNDKHLPTYVVYDNAINPDSYTSFDLADIHKLCEKGEGVAQITWNTKKQFARSIQTLVKRQIKDPITVYPLRMSATPLEDINDECRAMLAKEFNFVAKHIGLKKPWKLRVGDFSKIKSGERQWFIGGNACGGIYLDRIAREIGLSQIRTGVKQYKFRQQILKMMLWELYPEYRTLQHESDLKKDKDFDKKYAKERGLEVENTTNHDDTDCHD